MNPLEGKRLRPGTGPDIYFVFNGEAHWIPNMNVYHNFFDNVLFESPPALPVPTVPGTQIGTVPPVTIGSDFGSNACLIRNDGTGEIWVFDGTNAWHVPNMATFGFYGFTLNHFVSQGGGGIDWTSIASAGITTLEAVAAL